MINIYKIKNIMNTLFHISFILQVFHSLKHTKHYYLINCRKLNAIKQNLSIVNKRKIKFNLNELPVHLNWN